MTQLMNNSEQPQTVSELWPFKWLRAADLDKGKIVTITHQRIEMKKKFQSQEKEAKLILSFKNGTKELICTKTQARAIAELTGSETFADWPGTKVLLKPKLLPNGKYTIEVCQWLDLSDNEEDEPVPTTKIPQHWANQMRDPKSTEAQEDEVAF